MRRRLLSGAGGLALTILLTLGDHVSAADPSARLGKLNCEAGEIAKFDGQRWVCAQDETGAGGPTFAVYDAEGKQFGIVVDVVLGGGVVILEEFPVPSSTEVVRVLLHITPDEVRIRGELLFELENCAGSAWLQPSFSSGFPNAFEPAAITTDGAPDSNVRRLWVPVNDNLLRVHVESRFEITGGDGCVNFSEFGLPGQDVDAIEFQSVGPDLHQSFPPPYTLELLDGR